MNIKIILFMVLTMAIAGCSIDGTSSSECIELKAETVKVLPNGQDGPIPSGVRSKVVFNTALEVSYRSRGIGWAHCKETFWGNYVCSDKEYEETIDTDGGKWEVKFHNNPAAEGLSFSDITVKAVNCPLR